MSSLRLDGRVALITGGTRGIGFATAEALAAQGADIVLVGRTDSTHANEQAEVLVKRYGIRAIGRACDVAVPTAVSSLYSEVFKLFKRLDVLVNNAGILRESVIGMIQEELLEQVLEVNVAGQIRNLQLAARIMQRRGTGAIINVSSIVGLRGNVGQTVYSASKAAILGLTLSAAKELAPSGIRVNAVAPGFIETDMMSTLSPETRALTVANIPLKRPGTPSEVADVILFLASDLSRYITGQVLGVDGGMVI